jgi:hypothetical protein
MSENASRDMPTPIPIKVIEDTARDSRVRRTRRATALFVVLLAAAGLVAGPVAGQALRVGAAAPDVAGERWINSEPLTTPNLRGRVVLVEFWTFG